MFADTFATFANKGFDASFNINLINAWLTSLSYTFQLYFDFSGYTDMALGSALMLNIKLPINFNSPFKSKNLIEFWQRWHISLTNFITTYLFTPILKSFSKLTFTNSMVSLFLAMTIAGIWHGSSWNYLLFYTIHAAALIVNHIWKKFNMKMNNILGWFLTFNFVNITFTIFRGRDVNNAFEILKGMVGLNGIVLPKKLAYSFSFLKNIGVQFDSIRFVDKPKAIIFLMVAMLIILLLQNTNQLSVKIKPDPKIAIGLALITIVSVLNLSKISEFLYFNF